MVKKLIESGCTAEQTGAILEIDHRTLERRFAPVIKAAREARNGCLQKELYRRAMNGSDAIAIFLAKNWLGMTDRPDIVLNVQQNVGDPVSVEDLARYSRLMHEFALEQSGRPTLQALEDQAG